MTPTLYYSPGACSLAPHIALEEIGLPFSLMLVSTTNGVTRTPGHLRLNPKGRVPVLVTGDSVLTEVPAILVHLQCLMLTRRCYPACKKVWSGRSNGSTGYLEASTR